MPTPITVMICVGLASETVFLSFIPRRAELYEAEWRKNGNGNFCAALVVPFLLHQPAELNGYEPNKASPGAQWRRMEMVRAGS